MERIYDEIYKNTNRKLDNGILENQLKEINSRKTFRSNKSFSNIKKINKREEYFPEYNKNEFHSFLNQDNLYDSEEKNKLINKKEENRFNEKLKKINNSKKDLNLEAKNILKDFHDKTHFKGLNSIANYDKKGI